MSSTGISTPIQNCTGGACVPGYLWWNGYIPATQINSRDANGRPNGYEGVPANYKPAVTPLIPAGSTVLPPNAPANTNVSQFWDTNTVWIPLQNGAIQQTGFNTGLKPFQNQYIPGVRQWSLDASLFKTIRLREQSEPRFNADFFNVLNSPGNVNALGTANSDAAFLSTQASGNNPRSLQLTLRLTW